MAGIKDVAALAGVSISTVSYVMTGKRPIGANTRRRVLQAARELGYLAKNGGPAPLSGETHFVALSSPVHDFTSYTNYCAYFLNFLKAARQLGYETLLLTEETGDEQLRSIIDTGMVDGVALMDVTMNDPRIELAQFSSIPLISIGHPMNEINVPCIDTDFIEMGEMIVQTLCCNGHRRILFAGGKEIDYERKWRCKLPHSTQGINACCCCATQDSYRRKSLLTRMISMLPKTYLRGSSRVRTQQL